MVVLARVAETVLLALAILLQWRLAPGFERYVLKVIAGLGWSAAWFGNDFDAYFPLGPDAVIRTAGLAALLGVLLYQVMF